jgi:hypothetical protein
MRLRPSIAVAALALAAPLLLSSRPARAQGVPSAGQSVSQSSQGQAPSQQPPATAQPAPPVQQAGQFPVQPWRLPAVEIQGEPLPALREEERIGDYKQPRWTAVRRFPTTRMYVIPAGKVEAEYWLRYTFPVSNPTSQREVRNFYELGFGIGHRLQFDVYFVTQQEGHGPEAAIQLKREQLEVRYALADWGELWGNPTLYLEWQRRNGENDWIEPKILVGGQVAPGWHAGLNLVLEKELGGNLGQEYNVTAGLSRTIVDYTFHVGLEGYVETHDEKGKRFKFGTEERLFLAGPSFLVQPIRPVHILFTPMIGRGSAGGDDNSSKTMMRFWFITGWTF